MVTAEYKVSRCSRRCCVEDRGLRDGEWYYSVVIEEGEELIRRDYSAAAWKEPPPGTIGWWKSRMPEAGTRKMVLAPEPVLIDQLRRMEADESQGALRYLLALTMLRRRVVRCLPPGDASKAGPPSERLVSTANHDPAIQSEPEAGGAIGRMRLQVISDGSELEVFEFEITRRQAESLSEALQELLYCEATD